MTRIITSLLVAITCLAISCPVSAVDDNATLLPYLSDDVLAVGYVDLTKLDMPAIPGWLAQLGVLASRNLANATAEAQFLQGTINDLRNAGVSRVYVLLRTTDINDQGPTWVIPFTEGAKPQAVKELLLNGPEGGYPGGKRPEEIPGNWLIDAHNSLVGGYSEEQVTQQSAITPTQLDLADAWSAVGDGTVGLLVMGSSDSRRVVREMFPPLLPPFDKVTGTLLADRVRWAGAALSLPPKLSLKVVIETADETTAQTLQEAATNGLQLAAQVPDLQKVIPPAELQPLLDALTPQVSGTRLSIAPDDLTGNIERLSKLLAPPIQEVQQAAQRSQRMNQFKQIALAMHVYADSKKHEFPPRASRDAAGKPLLSWRVLILPYLDQKALYDQFHLDEPWDSEHNLKLARSIPSVYVDPDPALSGLAAEGKTPYVLPIGPGTLHDGAAAKSFRDIKDGTSNTIMLVEVVPDQAVVWTKPADWEVDLNDPWKGVKRADRDWFAAGYWDGHVQAMGPSTDNAKLKALITNDGGERIE